MKSSMPNSLAVSRGKCVERRPRTAIDAVQSKWDELGAMERTKLRVAWIKAFSNAPPHFLSMMFMRKALIWHEQCNRYGGLPPDLKRALKSVAAGHAVREPVSAMRAGTQLVREWNGRRYQVDVNDKGYEMNGKRFKSLSAIALHITGTNWSGPRFFGLKSKTAGSV